MATRTPRRLTSDERRRQLELAALASVAARGSTGFSIEDVAERAGVTRNLIYHYFPRGRRDLLLAAVDESGRQLTEDFVTDSELPLAERSQINFSNYMQHASEPSDAWRVLIDAGLAVDPELRAASARYRDRVVAAMARNHFGSGDPGRLARVALRSYVALAETALDEAREAGLDETQTMELVSRLLEVTVETVRTIEPRS